MLRDIAPKPDAGIIRRARRLRTDMSLPEVLLWRVLRTRPGGLKFRRQHPCGAFVLDFYCGDARLAIEIDGDTHSFGDRAARDAARDRHLATVGVTTLRVPATEILSNLEGVVERIVMVARARLPLHHPAAPGGPPPRAKLGED